MSAVRCTHATLDVSTIHAQVEKMHDEAVQLKVLQTALTLMQSTMLAQNEVSISTCTNHTYHDRACFRHDKRSHACCHAGGHRNGAGYMFQAADQFKKY